MKVRAHLPATKVKPVETAAIRVARVSIPATGAIGTSVRAKGPARRDSWTARLAGTAEHTREPVVKNAPGDHGVDVSDRVSAKAVWSKTRLVAIVVLRAEAVTKAADGIAGVPARVKDSAHRAPLTLKFVEIAAQRAGNVPTPVAGVIGVCVSVKVSAGPA